MVREREREESRGSERYSSGSPSKSSNPNGETGFLCGERERKGGVYRGRERGKDMGDMRQGGKCEKRKERSGLGYNFLTLFLPPSFCLSARHACTCPSYSRLY